MPNIPTTPAAGQINVSGKPSAGSQKYGPVAPDHGAAGGYAIDPAKVAPKRFFPQGGVTGLTRNDPEFGTR